jgi:hypothetical protein
MAAVDWDEAQPFGMKRMRQGIAGCAHRFSPSFVAGLDLNFRLLADIAAFCRGYCLC